MATALQIDTCPDSAGLSDCFALEAGAAPGAPRHGERVHRRQAVSLYVTEGVLRVRAGEHEQALAAGDAITVLAGTPYRLWNGGETEAAWIEVFRRR